MRQLSQAFFTFLLLCPRLAFADYEFYTFDGFQQITRAFQGIALIFNAPETLALAGTAATIGIVANGGLHIYRAGAGGGGFNPIAAFLPPMLGGALFVSLFVPTDNLHVYDAETNQFETVADVPVGIAILASSVNEIERGMVDLINTTFPDTEAAAGAMALMTAQEMFNISNINPYLYQSLQRYIQDCVVFEMARPGTTLSQETLRTATNSLGELAKAASPAVFTLKYAEGAIYGQAVTCQEAWSTAATGLQAQLAAPATYATHIGAACGRAKFDASDPQQLAKCTSSLTPLFAEDGPLDMGAAVTAEDLSRQALIADTIYEVAEGDTGSSMAYFARREITQKGFGAMIAANEWLPVFKACMMAIIIGLIPLIAVFVASNIGGAALRYLAGSFIFMAAWGVTDAIVTAASAPYIVNMFNSIRDTGLGLETLMNFPDYSTKAASVYGSLRSSAVAFAGMISFALMRFGGHALAQVGGGITGQMQGAGAVAGQAASPEGTSRIMESMVNSGATFATAGAYSYGERTAAKALQNATSMENHSAAMDAAGQLGLPTDTPSLASSMARANIPNMMVGNQAVSTKVNSGGGIAFGSIGGYNPDTGFSNNDTFGGGTTSINRPGSAGTVAGFKDTNGNFSYNQATAKNIDSKAIQGDGQRRVREGSESLSSDDKWNDATNLTNRLAQTSNAAKEFKSQLENSHQHALITGLLSSTDLSQQAKNELIKSMGGTLDGQGGVSWGDKGGPTGSVAIGADGEIRVRASDGSTSTIKLGDDQKDTLQQIERGARSEAWAQTLGNSATRDVATQVGHAIGAGHAVSQVTKGMDMQTLDNRQTADMMTAYHVDQAKQAYNTDNPTPEQMESVVKKTGDDIAGGGPQARARMEDIANFTAGFLQGHPTRTAAQDMITQSGDKAAGAYGQFADQHGAQIAEAKGQATQAGAAAQNGQPTALPDAPLSMVPPPVPGEDLPSNMDPPRGSVPLGNTHSGSPPPPLPAIPQGAMTPVNYDQREKVMNDKQEKIAAAAEEIQDFDIKDRILGWLRDKIPIPQKDGLIKDGKVNFNHLPSVSSDPQNLSANPTNPMGNPEDTKNSPYVGAPMSTTGGAYSQQQPDINDFLFENPQYGGKGEGKKP